MASINVRGLSDKTKEALRVRAAKAGMSLEAYARRALTKASTEEVEEPKPVAELAEAYFGARHGVELPIPPRAIR